MFINQNNLGNYVVPPSIKNGICLEIGSNVGNFFTKYKDFFKIIHYYEPVTDTFNISQSKSCLTDNVFGFNEAAYSSTGEVVEIVTHQNDESGSCSIKDGKQSWTNNVVSIVSSVSLESCIDRITTNEKSKIIDYLKIDCECCEYEFLNNKDLSSIRYIGMEIHNQRGENDWYSLLNHINKTHIIHGDTQYFTDRNTELFCELR